mmetsp:Transcript_8140/g.26708  ORF Transcript_8140/g.26708 Transcript_8140/m.26708 type:complete len:633 (-) Transcript_8140:217-2115(-)
MKVFLLACIAVARAFYLPGVAPRTFRYGDKVELKVNKLTSVHTQIPYDYYSMKFCKPHGGIKQANENLGEFLSGDLIENSPYQLHMEQDQFCKILCQVDLKAADVASLKSIIKDEYHNNWIIDNLPAASIVDSEQYIITAYAGGFPVGFQDHKASYVFNHVNIIVEYHPLDDGSRVVGFYVEPFTVKHKFKDDKVWDGNDASTAPPLETCDGVGPMVYEAIGTKQDVVEGPLLFTYDVLWRSSNVKWASRWDIYLSMDNAIPDKIHWFSIVNSLLIVLFLSVMVAMILVRNLHRDILRYNRVLSDEEKAEERDESGWKLVHADVFRPPATAPMLFCVCAGTGVQVLLCTAISIAFAAAGFLSPANRGSLITALLMLFVFMGAFAGYCSSRVYKAFRGTEWMKNTVLTAVLFPGFVFATFLGLDIALTCVGSSGAVPFSTLLMLVVLWFGVSVPLVFAGAYVGFKREIEPYPVRTNQIPRLVPPQPWYMHPVLTTTFGGILPFGAVSVELFFIMSAIWLHQVYYIFGFLFLVMMILVATCAEITILLCYFQLCNEDYHWWWRSFLTSGSTALYVFLYSAFYFSKLETNFALTYFLYFGYMSIISLGLFLVTGTVGFFSALWFNLVIFSSIKVD